MKTTAQLDREIAETLASGRRHMRGAPRAVDKLLERLDALGKKQIAASDELSVASRESDAIESNEERGRSVDPTRKDAARRRWSQAVQAEKSLTSKMRKTVLKIRAIDPTRVPWAWRNTR